MLLTISTTHRPATDLGYLLHKHPDRVQAFDLPFGVARVFYPEATEERCTVALLLAVDPVGLVRREEGGGFALAQYVNDRPYVASSFMSVALVTVFKTAMAGRCAGHEALAEAGIELEAWLPVVPARGGETFVRRVFEPLGYELEVEPLALDAARPEWGDSPYVALRLRATTRLAALLNHLYVLLPVLDGDKHYWVDEAEIDKLVRRGEGWLADHPERDTIVRRSLKRQRRLVDPALARLDEHASTPADAAGVAEPATALRDHRLGAVEAALKASGATTVLDLGCGPGALLARLLRDPVYQKVVGADVSVVALERAARRLHLDELDDDRRARIELLHSPLTYRDKRFAGYDAAVLMEVVEHLDPPRLQALEANVFGSAQPRTVVVTTPNADYNAVWETLSVGELRHPDHRFEFTRAQFAEWAGAVAERHDYTTRFVPVGAEDPELGPPTQMAVFTR